MRFGDLVTIGTESFHPQDGEVLVVPAHTRGTIVGDAGEGFASVMINIADLPTPAGGLDADDAIIITVAIADLVPLQQGSLN